MRLRSFLKTKERPGKRCRDLVKRGIDLVQHLDPAGVAASDLRECLLIQIAAQQAELSKVYAHHSVKTRHDELRQAASRAEAEAKLEERRRAMEVAAQIVQDHLQLLQKRDVKDLAKSLHVTPEEAHAGVEFIRTLEPRPGRLYNREQTRLIEPDVVFTKRGGEWVVSMNEEDLPSLRLSARYRRMLVAEGTEKEVKEYVKERFRSAMQLMRNIAQRKSTILRTCEVIVRRQQDFLDQGIEALRPMMIKEVAEEIGVHPSTVSRAVANKYAHTPQGVIELRFFFSEGSNGPEGADTPLLLLKRKVRKLIDDEDPRHPLTDDQLAANAAGAGHPADPAHGGKIPRRHEYPFHAPAKATRRLSSNAGYCCNSLPSGRILTSPRSLRSPLAFPVVFVCIYARALKGRIEVGLCLC